MDQPPINPLDLWYTNRFVGVNEIEMNENKTTRDRINVLKTIDRPYPKRFNRNWEPIISEEVRDVVKDRYKKNKVTTICIDSRDRNCDLYPKPNNYKVVLGKQFNYIESIRITGIDFGQIFITNTKLVWKFPFGEEYNIDIECGIYSTKDLEKMMIKSINSIPNQNFYLEIDPILNQIQIISRVESPQILAIQTILNEQDDIFRPFSSSPPNSYDTDGIYILINSLLIFNDMDNPLVPTCIPDIGGIPNTLFNFKEFWLQPINNINEYEFVDAIQISGISTSTFLRYKLTPVTKMGTISVNFAENIIISPALQKVVNGEIADYRGVYNKDISSCAAIGRAREFTFDFEKSTLLELFGWFECEEEFRYVLTNKSPNNVSKEKCFNIDRDKCCCDYMFRLEPYILLKLSLPSYAEDTLAGNIVKSQTLPMINNCGQCPDINSGVTNIFAKIILTNPIEIKTSVLEFYETPLDKLNEIIVTFVNRKGCVIDLKCDNVITLEVIEFVDVLKDTLLDSRHGEANITGLK